MPPQLSGKGALVTGGSRGIGRALVKRLTADGCTVVFSYNTNDDTAEQVAKETGAIACKADQGDMEQLAELFKRAEEVLPSLDFLVLNAALSSSSTISEATMDAYDRMFAVNTRSTFLALQWASRNMKEGGRIVALSTLNTMLPAKGNSLYQASKAATEQLVKVAAREFGPKKITCNIVSPGATDTDMLRGANSAEALKMLPAFTALGRLGEPEDVAGVVMMLLGDDAGWVTGQNILASGGMMI